MCSTLIECDPVSDRELWRGIQRERARLRRQNQQAGAPTSWDRLTVDSLVAAVQADAGATGGPRTASAVVVHVGLERLTGTDEAGLCETDSGVPVPVATARRLACESDIIPVVLDGRGIVLDEGRAKRLATAQQRTAIEAMQATCCHPDCTVSVDECRIHHLDPWEAGGPTDLANLVAVCEVHHHLVHEGGWSLAMTADRVATWTQPDGRVYSTGSVLDRDPTRHRRRAS